MINHDNKISYDDKYLSRLWQSALITLGVVFVLGFLTIRAINQSPAKPIYIQSNNLTAHEYESLAEVVHDFGAIAFFEGNLHQIHDSVMTLSWVEQAQVSRDWYRGVMVEVVPRQAIANFGSRQLIDVNGVVFHPANKNDVMNPDLVTLQGSVDEVWNIMQQTHYINELFSQTGLVVEDVILTPRHTWLIRFENGLRVVVDDENTEQKLHQLANIISTQLAERLDDMQSVDLRYKNGLAVSWKNGSQTTH